MLSMQRGRWQGWTMSSLTELSIVSKPRAFPFGGCDICAFILSIHW